MLLLLFWKMMKSDVGWILWNDFDFVGSDSNWKLDKTGGTREPIWQVTSDSGLDWNANLDGRACLLLDIISPSDLLRCAWRWLSELTILFILLLCKFWAFVENWGGGGGKLRVLIAVRFARSLSKLTFAYAMLFWLLFSKLVVISKSTEFRWL